MAVVAEGLRKRYGETTALDGFDLTVREGTVCGLLGPNGAGKTTAVRVLATLLRPDAGRAEVAGFDVVRQAPQVRYRIGLTGQQPAVDEVLTGRQNLVMFGRLYHLDPRTARRRADELLEQFGLAEAAGKSLVDAGTTVLLTTQYLDEADQLAQQVAVMDRGRVIADGTPDELKSAIGGDQLDVVLREVDELPGAAGIVGTVCGAEVDVDKDDRRISAPVRDRVAALTEVVRALDAAGIAAEDIALRRPTLDEVFLRLTGHRADAGEVSA